MNDARTLDDTRLRFLSAIARQIPADRVAELHLFAPIRLGGVESGVAVIAVERIPEPSLDVDGGYVPAALTTLAAELETADGVVVSDQLADESAFVADELIVDDESPYAAEPTAPEPANIVATAPSRYTVYSARYRATLKGLDRGKWEVVVTDQADAPLLTVDAVVRGVQRRSGDVDETLRLSGDDFRAALPPAVTVAA